MPKRRGQAGVMLLSTTLILDFFSRTRDNPQRRMGKPVPVDAGCFRVTSAVVFESPCPIAREYLT